MKWIRAILAVVVLVPVVLAVGLYVAGSREGAGRNVVRVEIDRPPQQVFRHVENVDLLKGWTGAKEIERLTPPPAQKGSRFRVVSVVRGTRTEVVSEITTLERGRRLAFAARTPPGAAAAFAQPAEYTLQERDGRTVLTVVIDTRYEGFLLRLLEPFITPGAQKELTRQLAALKSQTESEPRAGPGGAAPSD
jgi:uncharacterized protein YndB with AHSA1/START domain